MNWNLLLRELDKLNLPKDKYAITNSGCLAVRGIRNANDVDIIVSDDLFNQLSIKHIVTKSDTGAGKINISENVEVIGNFKSPPYAEELIESSDIIDNRRYVELKWIRYFKEKRGREKDLNDIKLIDEYLKQNGK